MIWPFKQSWRAETLCVQDGDGRLSARAGENVGGCPTVNDFKNYAPIRRIKMVVHGKQFVIVAVGDRQNPPLLVLKVILSNLSAIAGEQFAVAERAVMIKMVLRHCVHIRTIHDIPMFCSGVKDGDAVKDMHIRKAVLEIQQQLSLKPMLCSDGDIVNLIALKVVQRYFQKFIDRQNVGDNRWRFD